MRRRSPVPRCVSVVSARGEGAETSTHEIIAQWVNIQAVKTLNSRRVWDGDQREMLSDMLRVLSVEC